MPVLKFKDGSTRQFKFEPELVARLVRLSEDQNEANYTVDLDIGIPAKLKKEQNDLVQKEYDRLWLAERCGRGAVSGQRPEAV